MIPQPTKPRDIYLAGPMQGYPEFNFPTFHAVAHVLRQNGHTVFNPAEKDIERHGGVNISAGNAAGSIAEAKAKHGFSLRQALSEDMDFICLHADMIVLLPGWEKSNGAQAEHRTAVALQSEGMEILYLSAEIVELMKLAYANREQADAA
jgi:hypothetical protein